MIETTEIIESSYLNNPNLKKINVSIKYTEEQIQEWIKCSKDPIYFIENYYKIVNVDLGLIYLKLYKYQKKIIKTVRNSRHTICKLPRQAGKTTAVAGLILWYVLFHKDYSVAILAHKADQAREILARIKYAYEFIPKWLQQGIKEWNKGNIELENGSKILVSATTGGSIRGASINMVYL